MNGPKEYFVDTNIFLRAFVKEHEPSFAECSRILELIQTGAIRAVIDTLVFAEISWVLGRLYRFPKREVVMALHSVAQLNNLSINDQRDVLFGLSLYGQHDVTFIDAMIASHDLVAVSKIPIVSYDKDFDKLGVKRVTPSELTKTK